MFTILFSMFGTLCYCFQFHEFVSAFVIGLTYFSFSYFSDLSCSYGFFLKIHIILLFLSNFIKFYMVCSHTIIMFSIFRSAFVWFVRWKTFFFTPHYFKFIFRYAILFEYLSLFVCFAQLQCDLMSIWYISLSQFKL